MKNSLVKFLIVIVSTILSFNSWAQCAMCTATAENSLEEGSTAAKGLNDGILYMFAMVFIFPTVFFILYKRRKKFLKQFDEN